MQIDKTIVTKYSITLNKDDIKAAVLAYINSEESIELHECENEVSFDGLPYSVDVEATTEETE